MDFSCHRLLTAVAVALTAVTLNSRERIDLSRGWTFYAQDDTTGHTVNLPHDFLISQPWVPPGADENVDLSDASANRRSRLSARAFKEPTTGTYYYRFTPDEALRGRRVLVDFEGIMLVGDVWLNGEHIGKTDYGYLGFESDITGKLKFGTENELKVVALTGKPNHSRWYTGGGLYRPVSLTVTDPTLYFSRHGLWATTEAVTASTGRISPSVEIESRGKDDKVMIDLELTDPQGRTVMTRTDTLAVNRRWRHREYKLKDIELAEAQLWDVDHPSLYTLSATLRNASGDTTDRLTIKTGFRTVEFSPEFGMKLNGKKVLLKGIANHHTLGALGAAAYPRAIVKRLELLKQFGVNHVRTSHNPYSTDFLNACDSLGILVVDELYDKWLKDFSGGRADWSVQWQTDLPEWVRRDRSHPSVVMWSFGNELQGYNNLPYNDWGVTSYRLLKQLMERYDTTRPCTVAMHPRYRSLDTDSLPAPLVLETDIASYNYRYMYFPGDRRRFPNLIFYQSEANRSGMGPNFFEPDPDSTVGLAYWGLIDYLGESAGWPAKGWTQGVLDISLKPKPDAWLLKSLFADEPVVHIAITDKAGESYIWNDELMNAPALVDHFNFLPGDTVAATVYTNADEVELFHNGRYLGRIANPVDDAKSRNQLKFTPFPYRKGSLKAVAYKDGKRVGEHEILTAGKPVRIKAEADNQAWKADGTDLQHVRLHVVDPKGVTVPTVNEPIKVTVSGNAEIVAIDNGDIYSDELHSPVTSQSASRKARRGELLVILRSTTEPGDVTLTATTAGVKPLKTNFKTIH